MTTPAPAKGDEVAPVRLQLSRQKGFNLHALSLATNGLPAVNVARPGKFGNPFTMDGCRDAGWHGDDGAIAARCVEAFRAWIDSPFWRTNWQGPESERARNAALAGLPVLRGKNLACWCHLCPEHASGKPLGTICEACAPCHADVLLELANMRCEAASGIPVIEVED